MKFSIITAAYNAEDAIVDAIMSVQGQTYSDYEHIIVDDCSTDNTLSVVKEMAKKDRRINVLSLNKNTKKTGALNVGLAAASGDYICHLDSDDLYMPKTLENYSHVIKENPGIAGVMVRCLYDFGQSNKLKSFSQKICNYKIYQNLAVPSLFCFDNRYENGKPIHIWQWAFRSDIVPKSDTRFDFVGHDNDTFFSIVDKLDFFALSDYIGYAYRQSGGYTVPGSIENHLKQVKKYVELIREKDYGKIGNQMRDISLANNVDKLSKVR